MPRHRRIPPTPKPDPDCIELVRQASRDLDVAEKRVAECVAEETKKREELEQACAATMQARLEAADALLRLSRLLIAAHADHKQPEPGDEAAPSTTMAAAESPPPAPPATNGSAQSTAASSTASSSAPLKLDNILVIIDNVDIPKKWRVAFTLLADPVLDYQATALRLFGPTDDPKMAKNRVNAHLTLLKTLGIVETLGSNRYRVDRVKLAEHSGLPVPVEASS